MNTSIEPKDRERSSKLGIYEKAFPTSFDWEERFSAARRIGFDFIEFSIDQSSARMARLAWDEGAKQGFVKSAKEQQISVPTLCLSGLRSYPLGSSDDRVREEGLALVERAIHLAASLGISIVQLAGYDVYGEPSTPESRRRFKEQLGRALKTARKYSTVLAIENMETSATDSLAKVMEYIRYWDDPLLQAYVDVGNLIAMGHDLAEQLALAQGKIAAFHIKDVLPGICRDVPFKAGIVDFDHVFSTIKETGFAGLFVVEMWAASSMDADPVAEVEKAYRFIAGKLNQFGFSV
ncbi:MAG: L-ribulose-5-phosphate 3-epimerase [Sphaerochaeta sp.]|nr:L-ribulose-5-phosphate 3-epimerase [Sphaerochaeta sp.]